MLQAIDLQCTRSFRTLFTALAFDVGPGELLHVAGENGSGKTSLLRILCGLLEPDRGEVRWKGAPTRDLDGVFRRELVYIGHANGVKDELTPSENLRVACTFCGIAAPKAALDDALESFALMRFRDAPAKTLSQGQRRRVALARLPLAGDHPLWLLDEPWNALDDAAAALVQRLIDAHLDRGGAVVMTSHQPPAARVGGSVRTLTLRQIRAE